MKIPEITLNDLQLIFNKLRLEEGAVVVSFFFSKIFVFSNVDFVYKNILKECKSINKVYQMFSYTNLYILPDNYKPLFFDKLKNKDLPIVSFKELDVMEKEKKQIFETECRDFKLKSKKSNEISVNKIVVSNTETSDIENQFNIISRGLKQLADLGIESTITFNFRTNIIRQNRN